MQRFKAPIVIIGGGVAGLWLLARLQRLNKKALLFEQGSLGCKQSLLSQGMIHAGQRYQFAGSSHDADLGATARDIWLACLKGQGELDLSQTQCQALVQHLYFQGNLTGKVIGRLASQILQSNIKNLSHIEDAKLLELKQSKGGSLYELEEPVVDPKSLLSNLQNLGQHTYQATFKQAVFDSTKNDLTIKHLIMEDAQGSPFELTADFVCFCSGLGNEQIAKQASALQVTDMKTQRRPLKQLLLFHAPFSFNGHIIGHDPRPLMTITTSSSKKGHKVWYVGGKIASDSLGLNNEQSAKLLKSELQNYWKSIDWQHKTVASVDVERAEPYANNLLPDAPSFYNGKNFALAWPVKMTYAPLLTEHLIKMMAIQPFFDNHCIDFESMELELVKRVNQAKLADYPW